MKNLDKPVTPAAIDIRTALDAKLLDVEKGNISHQAGTEWAIQILAEAMETVIGPDYPTDIPGHGSKNRFINYAKAEQRQRLAELVGKTNLDEGENL